MPMSKQTLSVIGLEIKKHRMANNLSQEELSNRSGLDRTYISMLERGKRNFSILNLIKIAKALRVKPKAFLDLKYFK